MRKGLFITTISVGVLLVLMVLLPLAFQGKIADLVKKEGNQMLNAQFDFEELDISLFRHFPQASVTLENFWLKGTGDFAQDTLVYAGEVTASVNLLSLFGDSGFDISKITVEDARLHAIVLPDGRVNWEVVKTDSTVQADVPAEASEATFRIKLQQLKIDDMNLVYEDRQGDMLAEVRDFNLLCSGDLTSDRTLLQLEAEAEALNFQLNKIPFLSQARVGAKMDIDADLAQMKFTLKENTFRLNAIEAGIDGWVAMANAAMHMDLKLHTNEVGFKEILSLVPAIYAHEFGSLKAEGMAQLNAQVQGTLQGDTVPGFQVALQIKDGMFRYPSLPAGVERIQLNAQVQNPGGALDLTTVTVEPFSFSLAGNPFRMQAILKTPISDPEFLMEAKGMLDLGMIKQVYPLQEMELTGRFNADMQLAGRVSYIEQEKFDRMLASGTLGLTGMTLKRKDQPDVEIQKSLFTFTPKYLQLSETTLQIGDNDVTADCRFENYMGYALKGTTLKGQVNMRSNHFNLNDFMTAAPAEGSDSVVVASVDSVPAATGIVEVPRDLDLQLTASLKEVLFDKMTFRDMKGLLLVREGKVDMKNLSMQTMGGQVVMNGYYSTANLQKPVMKGSFQLDSLVFAQVYKELDMVQKMAPVFENLKGNFSGNLQVITDLDQSMSPVLSTMQGSGSLRTRDLSLSGVKVIDQIAQAVKRPQLKDIHAKDMTLQFTIENGRIETAPFDIKLGKYTMNLAGSTGLDQSIEYAGKIQLPEVSAGFSKPMTLDLKIGGSFTSPKVSVDTKSMATQAVEAVGDKALQQLGKNLGLDSATTANKDSLKKQVKEKVAEKALNFLNKLKK